MWLIGEEIVNLECFLPPGAKKLHLSRLNVRKMSDEQCFVLDEDFHFILHHSVHIMSAMLQTAL